MYFSFFVLETNMKCISYYLKKKKDLKASVVQTYLQSNLKWF